MTDSVGGAEPVSRETVFGDGLDRAHRFVAMLRRHGVERGVIGPREIDRIWQRHLLNSAVVSELLPSGVRVVDVGSGGGFPGVPLAIARPDLTVTLLEPMARRVDWLTEVAQTLELTNVRILRGRAADAEVRKAERGADAATARAVAAMAKLTPWCLPLVRPGGSLLAIKGVGAAEEVARDRRAMHAAGGEAVEIVMCGIGVLETPTTVVVVRKKAG